MATRIKPTRSLDRVGSALRDLGSEQSARAFVSKWLRDSADLDEVLERLSQIKPGATPRANLMNASAALRDSFKEAMPIPRNSLERSLGEWARAVHRANELGHNVARLLAPYFREQRAREDARERARIAALSVEQLVEEFSGSIGAGLARTGPCDVDQLELMKRAFAEAERLRSAVLMGVPTNLVAALASGTFEERLAQLRRLAHDIRRWSPTTAPTKRVRAKVKSEDWLDLSILLAWLPRVSPKQLAALLALGTGSYPRTATDAARKVRAADNWLQKYRYAVDFWKHEIATP